MGAKLERRRGDVNIDSFCNRGVLALRTVETAQAALTFGLLNLLSCKKIGIKGRRNFNKVLRWDGSEMKIYVDGSPDNSTSYTAGIYSRAATPVAIGINNYGDTPYYNYFNGTIDEARIYDEALDETQIKQHYNSGIIPEPSALLLLGAGLLSMSVFRCVYKPKN